MLSLLCPKKSDDINDKQEIYTRSRVHTVLTIDDLKAATEKCIQIL